MVKIAEGSRSRQIDRKTVNLAEQSSTEDDEVDSEGDSIMESSCHTETESEEEEEKVAN